jgi:hypothetical protein
MARSAGAVLKQPVVLPDSNVPSRRRSRQDFESAPPEQVMEESAIAPSPGGNIERDSDLIQQEVGAPAIEVADDSPLMTEDPNTLDQGGEAADFSHQPTPTAMDGASERRPAPQHAEFPPPLLAARTVETVHPKIASPEHVVYPANSIAVDHVDGAPLEHREITLEAMLDSAAALEVPDDLPTGFEIVAGVPVESSSESVIDEPVSVSPALGLPREAGGVPGMPVPPLEDAEPASHTEARSLESDEDHKAPDTVHRAVSGRPPSEAQLEQFERDRRAPSQPVADLPDTLEFAPADPHHMAETLAPELSVESDNRPIPSTLDRAVAPPQAEAPVRVPAQPDADDMQSLAGSAAEQTSKRVLQNPVGRPSVTGAALTGQGFEGDFEPSTVQVDSSTEPSTTRPADGEPVPDALHPAIDAMTDRTSAIVSESNDAIPGASEAEPLLGDRSPDRGVDRNADHHPHGVQEARTALSPVTNQQPVEIRVARRVGRPPGHDTQNTGSMQSETPSSRRDNPTTSRDANEFAGSIGRTVEGNVPRDDRSTARSSLSARAPVDAAMDDLFAARDTDRSPQAWLARLQHAIREEEQTVSGGPPIRSDIPVPSALPSLDTPIRSEPVLPRPPSTPPTPLPDSTRRFLRPLVGMDPSGVEVHRDERAAEITRVVKADALAVGDTVILNPEQSLETPETMGLLAHELTHIARRRMPRFVPPIVRGRTEVRESGGAAVLSEEEVLARQVETAVTTAARAVTSPVAEPIREHLPSGSIPKVLETAPTGTTGSSGHALLPTHDPWSGLPAPWEPFPAWLEAPPPTGAAPVEVAAAASPVGVGTPVAAPDVLPAAQGRDLPEESRGTSIAPGPHQGAPVEPDLDLLARQVYSILKRRLDVERRRNG